MTTRRGLHFDPDLPDTLLANFGEFCAIADRFPAWTPSRGKFDRGAYHS